MTDISLCPRNRHKPVEKKKSLLTKTKWEEHGNMDIKNMLSVGIKKVGDLSLCYALVRQMASDCTGKALIDSFLMRTIWLFWICNCNMRGSLYISESSTRKTIFCIGVWRFSVNRKDITEILAKARQIINIVYKFPVNSRSMFQGMGNSKYIKLQRQYLF